MIPIYWQDCKILQNIDPWTQAGKEKEQTLSRKMLGLKEMPPVSSKHESLFSKPVKIALAALGGLGALAATYLMKQYNLY